MIESSAALKQNLHIVLVHDLSRDKSLDPSFASTAKTRTLKSLFELTNVDEQIGK